MSRTFIQTDDIKDSNITATKMAANSVTSAAITDSAITNSKLAPLSVGQLNIISGAVGTTQIEPESITTPLLAPNSVTSVILAPGAVTGVELDTSAKQEVLEFKKVTAFVQVNQSAVVQGITNLDVSSIIGMTTVPAISGGVSEGVISDTPKNQATLRDSYTGEPALTNSMEIYGRLTFSNPGITTWLLSFYVKPVGGSETVTPIPQGLTQIDWQYLQRYNLNTVDESWAADDKFFNGTVDITEVMNINQLAKDVYTVPVLTNIGNSILAKPLETQIRDIVDGITTISPTLAPRTVPGLAIQINAITQLHMSAGSVGLTQIENNSVTTAAIRDLSITTDKLVDSSVDADKLASFSVITAKIYDAAVTQTKLSIAAVGITQLEDQAVGTTILRDGAVTQPKISAGAVGVTQIENQAVTQAKIANQAVGTTQIELQAIIEGLLQDYAVTNIKLAPNSVTTDKIADGTVIAVDIAPGAVDTLELSDSAVTNPKIAASAVTSDKIASGQVVKTISAFGQLTLTDNVAMYGGPAISITSDGISNAIRVDVTSLNLSQLSDVVISSPALDQVLTYNGSDWINGNPVNTSAGSGVVYFLDDAPSSDGNSTLSLFPDVSAEHAESAVVNNSTALLDAYLSAPLGRTQIDGGIWEFDIYRYVDNITSASTIVAQVLRRFVGAGTVAITGSGTSRTATITGGTPLLIGDANADMTLSGYIETLTQTFQITGFTSSSVVTVATPGGYVNESGVSYAVHRYLFQAETNAILDTTVALENVIVAEPPFTGLGFSDELSARYYARTTAVTNITVSLVHDGTTHYSHIHTPLVTRHNDLAGLQGGTSNEYYHLTSTQSSYLSTLTGNVQTQLNGKATQALDNLTNVAINADLLPASDNAIDVGSVSKNVRDVHVKGSLVLQQTGAGTNAISVKAPISVTSYPIALPAVQGLSNTFPQNDGTGVLNWNLVNTDGIISQAVTQPKVANQAVGTTQIELQAIITSLIRDLAVTNDKLAPNSVTSDKIADGTVIEVDIAPSAVDTLELSNSAVTNPKLAVNAIATANITDSAVTNPKLAINSVTSTNISDASVTNSKLAVNSVTNTNISDSAITQSKISAGAVGTTQIELQSIITSLIRDLAVTNDKLGFGSVTSDKIADGTVIAADIAPSAVDTLELSNSAVTNPKLAVNAVATVNITDAAVTNPKLAVNAVASTNITDSAITQTKIAAGAVGLTQIESQSIVTGLLRDGNVTNAKLAANSVDTLQLSNSSVTNPKLAVNAVTSTNVSDSAITQTKIAAAAVGLTQIENQSIVTAAIRDQNVTQVKIANGAVGITQLEPSVLASVHHHYVNVAPNVAPDGITTIFTFTIPGNPISAQENIFVNGVLRYSGASDDYVPTYLTNQLVVNFTFVPTNTSRITASGTY